MIPLLAQANPSPAASCAEMSVLMLLMLGVFYVMYIRPQMKEQKKHKEWLAAMKKGDEVVTQGGMIGKIHQVGTATVTLEIARGVHVRMLKSQVQGVYKEGAADTEKPAEAEPKTDAKGDAAPAADGSPEPTGPRKKKKKKRGASPDSQEETK